MELVVVLNTVLYKREENKKILTNTNEIIKAFLNIQTFSFHKAK